VTHSDFQSRLVDSDGVHVACTTLGDPRAQMVVLLHGFPARWSTWRQTMRSLADAGFFAVAPDLRGYGKSDKPAAVAAYSAPRIADDVANVIHAFDRQRAHVVGHDFGGGVAWATAMFHADVVARMATLNSVHPVGFERQIKKWSQLKKSWYVFFFLLPRLPEWWLSRHDFAFVKRGLRDDGLDDATVDDLIEGIRPAGALHAAIDWYRASFRRIAPAKVEAATLAIWGDRERHLDAELAEPPHDWVPNARVAHVPSGSHWVHHDAPEEVAALLVEHFRA
jgi:pimeloyl-ACP methyl ester carboxylesterase